MTSMKKRIAALALALVMCIGMLPGSAFATEEELENAASTVVTGVEGNGQESGTPESTTPETETATGDQTAIAGNSATVPEGTVIETEDQDEPPAAPAAPATQDDLDAAFEKVGETDDVDTALAALDEYLAVYDRLSDEDKAANAEALAMAQAYRDSLVAGKEAGENEDEDEDDDEGLDSGMYVEPGVNMMIAAGTHTIQIRYQIIGSVAPRTIGSETCTYSNPLNGGDGWGYTIPSHTKYQSSFPSGYEFDHVEYAWDGNNHGYVTEGQRINIYSTGMAVYFMLRAKETGGSSGSGSGSGGGNVASGNHSVACTFTVLYVDESFNIGYNYGDSYSTTFKCQYSSCGTSSYSNHCIAISDIGAARSQVSVNSGYSIVGWSKSASANPSINTKWTGTGYGSGGTTLQKNGIIYLVAKKDPTYTYTLNFNGNGGTVNGETTYTVTSPETFASSYNFASVKPDSRSGYKFLGWATTPGAGSPDVSFPYTVNSSNNGKTLYAVWQKVNQVTLTYDANGGSNPPTAQTANPGEGIVVKGKGSMTNGSSEFLGWSENPNATTAEIEPGETVGIDTDTTLYAVWKQNAPKIIYAPGVGGTGGKTVGEWNESTRTVKKLYGAGITAKDGYTFLNSYLGSDGKTYEPGDDIAKPASDLTLTAIWKAPTPADPGTTTGNFTVSKSFRGLENGTEGPAVTLTYEAYRTKDGAKVGNSETGNVTLNKQSDGTYSGAITPTIWDFGGFPNDFDKSAYKNVVEISENLSTAEVKGYTFNGFSALYLADGSKVDNDTVRFTLDGTTYQKTLSVKNSYTKNPEPKLVITKTADKDTYFSGETITYTVTMKNTSGVPVVHVNIYEDMDPKFGGTSNYITEATPSKGGWGQVDNTGSKGYLRYRWSNIGDNLDQIPAGGEVTLTLKVIAPTVTAETEVFNRATCETYALYENGGTNPSKWVMKPADAANTTQADEVIVTVKPRPQATVTWYDENGTTVLDGPTEFVKGTTEPSYSKTTPTKAEDKNYTYTFKEWVKMDDSTEDAIKYKATYTATPKAPVNPDPTYAIKVTKALNTTGTVKNGDEVGYTVTVTNKSTAPLYNLAIDDTADAGLSLKEIVSATYKNGDSTTNIDLPTVKTATENGKTVNTWEGVLPEFAVDGVVTLTYKATVTNEGTAKVTLANVAHAKGFKTAPTAGLNSAKSVAPVGIMLLSNDGYDVEDSSSSSATVVIPPAKDYVEDWSDERTDAEGTGSNGGTKVEVDPSDPTPTPTEYTVTVKYVDENGTPIAGYSDVKVATTDGGKYNVNDKKIVIDGYTYQSADKALEGTVTENTTITLTYKKNGGSGDPTTTHTVTWIDGYNNSRIDQVTVNDGDADPAATDRPAPTHSGYRFTGWTTTTDSDGNVTYTANYTRTGGGGNNDRDDDDDDRDPTPTPTPTPTPSVEPSVEPTPAPSTEPTPAPVEEELNDQETPLTDIPEVEDLEDQETPLAGLPEELEEMEDLEDQDVPLAEAPQTGDPASLWGMAAGLSGAGFLLLSKGGKKKEEEED